MIEPETWSHERREHQTKKHFTWFRRPLGKLLDRASLTRLETLLVVNPRPKMPLLMELAVLRELLALVVLAEEAPVAPGALLLATAANVSRRETALDSGRGTPPVVAWSPPP